MIEYLVSHGCAGSLGRFRSEHDALRRGVDVVICGRRGLEIGTVLGPVKHNAFADEFVGDILRSPTPADRDCKRRNEELAERLCGEAETIVAEMDFPFTVLDAEVLLDGRSAILHGLSHAACDLGPLLERLGERHELIVRLYDVSAESPPPSPADDVEEQFKCDKPDCGEGECTDCGSDDGGCSSCSAGGAKELANHFAQLREQMEQARVPLM